MGAFFYASYKRAHYRMNYAEKCALLRLDNQKNIK